MGKNFKFSLGRDDLSKSFNVALFENPFFFVIGPAAWVVVSSPETEGEGFKKRFGFQYKGAAISEGKIDLARVYVDRLQCAGRISEYMLKRFG